MFSPTTTPTATEAPAMDCTCPTPICSGYCPAGNREHYAYLYGTPAMTTAETLDAARIPHHLPSTTDERTSA